MKIVYADEFVKRFNKLPTTIKKKAVKQELLFSANPLHPSLNTEKLIPKSKQLWIFELILSTESSLRTAKMVS